MMITRFSHFVWMAILLATLPSFALTHYVDVNSTNPVAPYTNWATAANVIQDAVDAGNPGDTVLVTNGVYDTGGKAIHGTMTNRVAVDKPLMLLSVNGPEFTIIKGYQVPSSTNGDGAVRCVYLADGATLSGFTLTNGGTRASGDFDEEQSGGGVWCISTNAWASNCVMVGNSSRSGAGAYRGTLDRCRLTANSSSGSGGGAAYSVLYNSALMGNSALNAGGGSYRATLNNCTLTGNWAGKRGGGCFLGTANNCIVYFNAAPKGENYSGITSESAIFNYSCTTPLPSIGTGNTSEDPLLASAWRMSPGSPCRGAGGSSYSSGTDLDGEPWAAPPSMGCDEYWSGSLTGALNVAIQVSHTNVAEGFGVDFTAHIEGRATSSAWDVGDGVALTNQPYTSHSWNAAGQYPVVLTAYNETWVAGVSETVMVQVVERPVHYVSMSGGNPVPPYDSWSTAATNIQDAVDAASILGALVLVTNGVYATGGKAIYGTMTNRVAVDRLLTLQSVNGPEVTVIQGYQVPGTTNGDGAIRCVYLTNGALLSGFTLTNGGTLASGDTFSDQSGGGLWCESADAWVSNCVVTGNSAYSLGGGSFRGTLVSCSIERNLTQSDTGQGGGNRDGRLVDCVIIGNSAVYGGGAAWAELHGCTISSNRALDLDSAKVGAYAAGGGIYEGELADCILTGNSAGRYGGGTYSSVSDNCSYVSNSAGWYGGGARNGHLRHCTFLGNSADRGGAFAANWSGWTLNNCALSGNMAALDGGGAYGGTLNNCSIASNMAGRNGGGSNGERNSGFLNNCIVFFNVAALGDNYYQGRLEYSCTTPLPSKGIGNITNAPLFLDTNGWSNLRLQSTSPCINAGDNAYVTSTNDLGGDLRVVGGTVDMGAYEFQSPQSMLSYAWLQKYGLPTDGSADYAHSDTDLHNNWQEWKAWTDPTNALSVLRMLNPQPGTNGTLVSWESVAGHSYFLERATNLTAPFSLLQSNIVGEAGVTSFTDTNVVGSGPHYYRTGVAE